MTLGDFLSSPRPVWDWIGHDCSRWLDRWIVACGHLSPMAATRIAYDGPVSALRTIHRGGGLLNLWSGGMEAVGIPVVDRPAEGDAAILAVPTDDHVNQTCSIWTGKRWATCHRGGLMFGVGTPLRVWSVGWAA